MKEESVRGDAERRATASRGQPSNGNSFRDSDGMVRDSNEAISGATFSHENSAVSAVYSVSDMACSLAQL